MLKVLKCSFGEKDGENLWEKLRRITKSQGGKETKEGCLDWSRFG